MKLQIFMNYKGMRNCHLGNCINIRPRISTLLSQYNKILFPAYNHARLCKMMYIKIPKHSKIFPFRFWNGGSRLLRGRESKYTVNITNNHYDYKVLVGVVQGGVSHFNTFMENFMTFFVRWKSSYSFCVSDKHFLMFLVHYKK